MGSTAALAARNSCAYAHEFDRANTRHTARGRVCRRCEAERARRYRERRKAQAAA